MVDVEVPGVMSCPAGTRGEYADTFPEGPVVIDGGLGGSADSGFLEVTAAAMGDLNGDGEIDVVLAFTCSQGASTYGARVVALDGTGPEGLGATEFLNVGYVPEIEVVGAEVFVLARTFEADDPFCCPTGADLARYALIDGQLVEI